MLMGIMLAPQVVVKTTLCASNPKTRLAKCVYITITMLKKALSLGSICQSIVVY